MKSLGILFLTIIIISAYSQEKDIFISDKLEKKWETPSDFKVPESVCFDPVNQVLYVSNINGKPTEKDGNGFISIVSLEGEIIELEWISGLHAPKGMGIFGGKLYVTDIDRVAEIDIGSGSIVKFYDFPGSQFLNDIDIDQKGAVYISDMRATSIYRIYNGKQELWLDDEILTGPNGLFVEGEVLLIGCKKIVRADIKD